jgi:hypothetical protein
LFSDSVGLLLVHIIWLTDGKLRLYRAGTKQPLRGEIPCRLTRNIKETLVVLIRWLSIVDPVVELGSFLFRLKDTIHGFFTLI